jgi:hypothetical protein
MELNVTKVGHSTTDDKSSCSIVFTTTSEWVLLKRQYLVDDGVFYLVNTLMFEDKKRLNNFPKD